MRPFRTHKRRIRDTLHAVDGLVESHLRSENLGGEPLARLAATMAIDLSGASRGALLLDRGEGLAPALTLRATLEPDPQGSELLDVALVSRVTASGEASDADGHVAAPVIVAGQLKGILYLVGDTSRFGVKTLPLATAVATRIASLLESAELVDQVTRQREGLEMLADLSAMLTTSSLSGHTLDRALEAGVHATQSRWGLLGLFDTDGSLADLRVHGTSLESPKQMAARLAERLLAANHEDASSPLSNDPDDASHLIVPLSVDLVVPEPSGGHRRPVGFFAVGRVDGPPYTGDDVALFRAVVHLVDAAVARLDYFQRATEDPVTETGSRLALQLNLAEAHARVLRDGGSYAVILTDIDHFKRINDSHGHLVGDSVLREIAECLRERLRTSDFVARYGGDEFVLILPETPASEAQDLAEELRARISRRQFTDHRLGVTVSMGVATASRASIDALSVLNEADRALYQSKAAGRNRVTLFSGRRSSDRR